MKTFLFILTGILPFVLPAHAVLYGKTEKGTNLWTTEIGAYSDCSPALTPDGEIYAGSWNGKFFAIDTNGGIKWTFSTGTEIKSSPAIATDGTIYFGCRNCKVYALTPTGKMKWSLKTGAWVDSSPAIGTDGTIYFGSWDKIFYALNPEGSIKWKFETLGEITSSPAIATDGTIYFGSHDKIFYALNFDGSKKWEFKTGGQILSSPAITEDGGVLFTATDGNFYALNADGTLRWKLKTGGMTESSPVVDVTGDIRIGLNDNFGAITAGGELDLMSPCNGFVDMTPAVGADRMFYFGSHSQSFYALLPTPERPKPYTAHWLWGVWLHGPVNSSPVIAPNNKIYVVSNNGMLNAIQGAAPLAKSSWPMFRGNPRHTGNVADNGK